jgi:hypothetical protein
MPSSRARCLLPLAIACCSSARHRDAAVGVGGTGGVGLGFGSGVVGGSGVGRGSGPGHGFGGFGMSLDKTMRAALMKVVNCKRGARDRGIAIAETVINSN